MRLHGIGALQLGSFKKFKKLLLFHLFRKDERCC